jgi:hypothetical protein
MKFIITILALASAALGAPLAQTRIDTNGDIVTTITLSTQKQKPPTEPIPEPVWDPVTYPFPEPSSAPLPKPTSAPLPNSDRAQALIPEVSPGSCTPAQYACTDDLAGWKVCQTWGEWTVSTI